MAGISPVNNSQTTTVQNTSGSLQVNQNQFIELFVAQLNRQDPLAPLDTNQMLTQLSQISSVESLNSIDERISGFTSSLEQTQMLGAAQLVGKEIQVSTNRVSLQESTDIQGQAELPVNAGDVLIRVYDSNGSMVESISLGPQQAGSVPFSLDTLAPGNYTITATAVSGDQAYAAGVGLKARVTGVEVGIGGASLQLSGIGSFPLSSVSMIGE